MTGDNLRVLAEKKPWGSEIELLVLDKTAGREAYGQPVTMQAVEAQGACMPEPTLTLTYQAAQQLMDELWQCGLRPSEGSGSAGQLAATQKHLKDMQQIAFKMLKMP